MFERVIERLRTHVKNYQELSNDKTGVLSLYTKDDYRSMIPEYKQAITVLKNAKSVTMKCDLNRCPYNVPHPEGSFCGDSKTNFINECPNPKEKKAVLKPVEFTSTSTNKQNSVISEIASEMERSATVTEYTDPDVVRCAIEKWARQLRAL